MRHRWNTVVWTGGSRLGVGGVVRSISAWQRRLDGVAAGVGRRVQIWLMFVWYVSAFVEVGRAIVV